MKLVIELNDGSKLVASQTEGEFNKEISIGIEDEQGRFVQDLAIIRPTYKIENMNVNFDSDVFEVLVYGDEQKEDYTNRFVIRRYKEDE